MGQTIAASLLRILIYSAKIVNVWNFIMGAGNCYIDKKQYMNFHITLLYLWIYVCEFIAFCLLEHKCQNKAGQKNWCFLWLDWAICRGHKPKSAQRLFVLVSLPIFTDFETCLVNFWLHFFFSRTQKTKNHFKFPDEVWQNMLSHSGSLI